jgi:carbon storage regulator CsrA
MSLTLSRKPGQSIRVGNEVFITVVQCCRGETRISIDAPKQQEIVRGEKDETGNPPDSRRVRRLPVSRARRLTRAARHRRGYRKSGTAVGFIRQFKAVMPHALPPLELRRDALALWILRRRRGDSDSAGAAVLA